MMKLLDENAVVFKCNGGFYLHGVEKIKCVNGTWSAAFPACRKGKRFVQDCMITITEATVTAIARLVVSQPIPMGFFDLGNEN